MVVHLQHYRFSPEEYEAMLAHGIHPEDDRLYPAEAPATYSVEEKSGK